MEHVLGLKSVFPLFDCTISVDNTADYGTASSAAAAASSPAASSAAAAASPTVGTVDIDSSYFIKLIYPPNLISKFHSLGNFLRILSHSHNKKADATTSTASPTASPDRGGSMFLNKYPPAYQARLLADSPR